jgi:hypothetical protein
MKNTRTGGYLRQLLHLIGKFIEDKQNGKRFTITGGKITNYQYIIVVLFVYCVVCNPCH